MIIGLGIDIVDIARLEAIYSRFGRRFLEKIFTPRELSVLPDNALSHIAGRFAAKEAAVKALGTGFSRGIGPQDIETLRNENGDPQLHFLQQAALRAQSLGVARGHLSISHERSVAAAVVVLEA
ncbi:holo-[acyl-carrier-protein] synthase [Candidatus Desulfovibrio trichonymphae]|uniref:Holo-[acyl-carrier-protein] synthase n=1 Tax=Candidatus Desulfovibrio trichonymphae TaxID=1725232 RepID=A0A1J1DU84_9BACT|nr:holo-[acyl-carrier-protein] synthase [Candidatus Desulfovibrio trichonymphae]BAV92261.1 4'-phosphopantetheinyl transferase [Candidatus Desulfovibrio trichonymphae]GHU92654.1 holo-[acyl-carrier-protein] synthase [Deltaproteobacteria bacterium]GHU94259.1 holo-[acyl-carrier-protein] synthase [Deltaproteobacteria bacterium]